MFDTLFGAEMPLAVRFFLAFLVVLALIGATAWAVRRFGAGRLGGASARGRQPRLAVVDYASVDGRRRLILVRRDNIEHLLMIGGPTDVVVEPNIVRAIAAPRDVPGARPAVGIDTLPRAIPLPENGSNGSWPLQPEPTAGLRPSPRLEPLPDELSPRAFPTQPETPPRATLSALADELAPRPATPPRARTPSAPRAEVDEPPEPRLEMPTEDRAELTAEPEDEPREEIQFEPRQESRQEQRQPPRHESRVEARKPPPAVTAAAAAPADESETTDQSLTDMAQRLEAALRKPGHEARPGSQTPARAAAKGAPTGAGLPPPPPPPRNPRLGDAKLPRPDTKPNQGKTTLYDSLEQEMASLLGRSNKT